MSSTPPPPVPTGAGTTEVIVVTDSPTPPEMLDVPTEASLWARLGAEAFGTFALVLVILGTALYTNVTSLGTLGGALATGLVLAGLIAALGHISGGHFNPAVSLGAAFTGRLTWLDLPLYWIAQVIGGLLAAGVLFATFPSKLAEGLVGAGSDTGDLFATISNGWGEHSPLNSMTASYASSAGIDPITFGWSTAMLFEALATAIFVAVTIGVVHRKAAAGVGPFAVGFTLSAMLLVTGIVTGGGVNPARSTASAIFSGSESLGQLWLFWLAPLLGAAIVGLFAMAFAPVPAATYVYIDDDEDDEDDDEVELA